MKVPAFFFALFLGNLQLSAQCLTLSNCPATAQTVCDYSINSAELWNEPFWYDPIFGSHDLAEAPTDLSMQVTSNCGLENVQVSFVLLLDLNGDGVRETAISSKALPGADTLYFGNAANPNYSGGTVRHFDERPVPANQKYRFVLEKTIQDNVLTARVRWSTLAMPGNYLLPELPYKYHRIEWRFEKDGESVTCGYYFSAKDCQAPTVTCLNGLSVNIMPIMMIQLWATDFLQNAKDNITPVNQLVYGVRRSGTGVGFPIDGNGQAISSVVFTCDDLGSQPVELWAMDAAGNASFCAISVLVQDNNGNCNGNMGPYTACAQSACYGNLEETTFEISGTNPAVPPFSFYANTNQNGCMGFSLPMVSGLKITPAKDGDPLMGLVSNYDLVLIGKHIAGTLPFTSNQQWVAADTDLNGVIDSVDMQNCSKLMLGFQDAVVYPGFRFYPLSFVFPTGNPLALPIPNYVLLDSATLSQPIVFVGVKTCDISCMPISGTDDLAANSANIGLAQPNPTAAGLVIPLTLLQSAMVEIELLDLTGRLLYRTSVCLGAGDQQLEVPATAFPQAGLYCWRVQVGAELRSGKVFKQ